MIIGIPKESEVLKRIEEKRVGISPAGVRELVDLGAQIYVAADAGAGAGFRNGDFRSAGAQVVYSNEQVIRRADVVLQAGRPAQHEWAFFKEDSALLTFLHMAVAPVALVRVLIDKRMTALGYEAVQRDDGSLPILAVSSEIAGKMAAQLAGRLLECTSGGRGVLLGGIPGIPPADVVIIGGGKLGYYAARSFLGAGASVYILDRSLERLAWLDEAFQGRVVTALSTQYNLEKYVPFADVLVGAVLVPGRVAPVLVTEAMVSRMSPGSVIIDFSIDQGGCVETSRLTPGEDFLFTKNGVLHFCAPNVPAMVARTSTYALTNVVLPYVRRIVKIGVEAALREDSALARGVYLHKGFATRDLPFEDLPIRNLELLGNELVR